MSPDHPPTIAELRAEFPPADLGFCRKAIELYEAGRDYNVARKAAIDPDSDPDALAAAVRRAREAKNRLRVIARRNR